MKNTRVIGKKYEEEALKILKSKGYSEVTRNYTCKIGEIDLIVERDNTLIFVEVKYRSRKDYGEGYESVGRRKQRKLYMTALSFIQGKRYIDYNMRFDIISFYGEDYRWIKNCFWGDELGF